MSRLSKPSPFIAARCSKKMKKRVRDAEQSTGCSESDFVRAAVDEFFARHRSPQAVIAAIVAHRSPPSFKATKI